jgi:hypothetical protein
MRWLISQDDKQERRKYARVSGDSHWSANKSGCRPLQSSALSVLRGAIDYLSTDDTLEFAT